MSRSKRLQPIADLAAHKEQEATKQLGEIQTRLLQQEKLLTDLEQYHAEYTSSNLISSTASANPVRLQDYRLFLERLEQAIVRQHQLIARLRDELAASQSNWARQRSDRRALENASGRFAAIEEKQEQKLEQQQIEEVSSLLRIRKLTLS